MQKSISFVSFFFIMMVFQFLPLAGFAQEAKVDQEIELDLKVLDATTVAGGPYRINLWGIEKIGVKDPLFNLEARDQLEYIIGAKTSTCVIRSREEGFDVTAQCSNSGDKDLALFMLQNGYVTADRLAIKDTPFDNIYRQAEKLAQHEGKGAWMTKPTGEIRGDTQTRHFMIGSFALLFVFLIAVVYIMRGFKKITDMQNQSLELAMKERSIRNKEKYVLASMLHSEIRANKAKINAYLTIYEETLRGMKEKPSGKYHKTGEIIQKQPALDRSVFDGNTSKLDLLGASLSSSVIHYYARIKSQPDYVEVDPDMPEEKVKELVEKCINHAKKLDLISDKLQNSFKEHALLQNKGHD
ncbi:MAG: hypothetical protein GC137_03555 [Alphaproteobacteria bacterium]|nr:hypothetical protein [Alphaproteobacteria bacterium]